MRRINSSLLAAVLVLLVGACQRETTPEEEPVRLVFTANGEASKATVSEGETAAKFLWETSDEVGLVGSVKNYKAAVMEGAGESSATFAVTEALAADEDLNYAVHPYSSLDGGEFIYPAVYDNYAGASFPAPLLAQMPENFEMKDGVIDYGNLYFRHIGGFVRVEVTGIPAGVNSMTFTSAEGILINGRAAIKDELSAGDFTGGSSVTTFNFPAVESGSSMVFFVPVPAGTTFGREGVTVSMLKDGTALCTKSFDFKNGYTVGRAKILRSLKMDMSIRFATSAAGIGYGYKGASQNLVIEGDLSGKEWDVAASTSFADAYGTVTKKDGYVVLTLPSSQFPARGPVTVKLTVDGKLRDVITVYQDTWFNTGSFGNPDGSVTIVVDGASKCIGLKEGIRFGNLTFNLSEVDLSSAELYLDWWGTGNMQYYAGVNNLMYVGFSGINSPVKVTYQCPELSSITQFKYVSKSLDGGAFPAELWLNGVKVATAKPYVNDQSYLWNNTFRYNFGIRDLNKVSKGKITITSVKVEPEKNVDMGGASGEDLGIDEYR